MMAAMANSLSLPPQSAKPVEPATLASQPDLLWNAAECLEELDCNGEPEVLLDVIGMFVEDGARRLAELRHAAKGGQMAEVRAQAHSLKGSSSQVCAKQMAALCARIEQCCGRPPGAELPSLLDQLEASFDSTRRAMLVYEAEGAGN